MPYRLIFLTLLLLAPLHNVLAASQETPPVQRSLRAGQQSQETEPRITRSQASDIARDIYNARVVSIRFDRGRWRMRMDQEGNVFDVMVNASSGEVSRLSE